MNHAAVEGLLGAYAIDAVDRDEAGLVEAHLADCPRCVDEVQQHRETASFLAQAGGAAPDGLWERIAGELSEAPPMAAPVLPFARPARPAGRTGRSRLVVSMAAVAAVAALTSLLLAVKVVDQDRHLRDLDAALASGGMRQVAEAALLHPEGRKVDLRSGDGSQWAVAVVLPNGEGYIVRDGLASLGDDQTYQLWGLVEGELISLGLLGNDPDIASFSLDQRTTMLALTAEKAGGVVSSTNEPVATGVIPV